MKNRIISLLLLILSGLGCSSNDIPVAGENHPAHPDAAVTPDREFANPLEVDKDELPRMPPEMGGSETHMMNKSEENQVSSMEHRT
jgi:hypothetical protein